MIRSRSLEDSQRGVQAQFVEHQQAFSALAPPPGDVSANKVPVIDGMHNKGDEEHSQSTTMDFSSIQLTHAKGSHADTTHRR